MKRSCRGLFVALIVASVLFTLFDLPRAASADGERSHRGDSAAERRWHRIEDGWMGRAPRSYPVIGTVAGDDALRRLLLRTSRDAVADRVILVSIDGLRPDAITEESAPTLRRIFREGARARLAHTLERSITLPSHASMLTGVSPEVHGVHWNGLRRHRGKIRYPSVLRIARAAGLRTAMFVGKAKLEHMAHARDLDAYEVAGPRCRLVNRRARRYLETMSSGLAFLHYPDPDGAGHGQGWMSESYIRAVSRADGCVETLLDILEGSGDMERTLLVITSDHGGHQRTHGSAREEDVAIPWVAYGGPVRSHTVARPVHTTDTAPTLLEALGLPLPHGQMGRPVPLVPVAATGEID